VVRCASRKALPLLPLMNGLLRGLSGGSHERNANALAGNGRGTASVAEARLNPAGGQPVIVTAGAGGCGDPAAAGASKLTHGGAFCRSGGTVVGTVVGSEVSFARSMLCFG